MANHLSLDSLASAFKDILPFCEDLGPETFTGEVDGRKNIAPFVGLYGINYRPGGGAVRGVGDLTEEERLRMAAPGLLYEIAFGRQRPRGHCPSYIFKVEGVYIIVNDDGISAGKGPGPDTDGRMPYLSRMSSILLLKGDNLYVARAAGRRTPDGLDPRDIGGEEFIMQDRRPPDAA